MARVSNQQLQLELEVLRNKVASLEADAAAPSTVYRHRSSYASCKTPAERAAYLREFNKRKSRGRDRRAMRAPAPGESPTIRERLQVAADALGVPVIKLRVQSGHIWLGDRDLGEV
jgi:hypothetical protein